MSHGGGSSPKQPHGNSSDGELLSSSKNDDEPLRGASTDPPPSNILDLWIDVANGIDKSQTGKPAQYFSTFDNLALCVDTRILSMQKERFM